MRFLLLAAGLLAAGPALAGPVTIDTARGPVSLEAMPQKVAVFDLASLDTLAALGVKPAGAPAGVTLPYLKDDLAEAKPVGTVFEPDLEALSALAPDLTIVGARSAAKYDAVRQVGPAIDMTTGADLMASLEARLAAYGALFGKEAKAQELTAALKAQVAAVQGIGKDRGTALILLTNGPKMSAFGLGSRFGWLHQVTGLAQAHPGLKTDVHGNAVSFEFIAEADPDWIFVVDRGAAIGADGPSAAQTLDNPLVAGTKAAQAGHIVYLNAADMYVGNGGYQATLEILGELAQALER